MRQITDSVTTQKNGITIQLIKQIIVAIKNIRWGSVEIYLQNGEVIQITERKITKPLSEQKQQVQKNGKIPS